MELEVYGIGFYKLADKNHNGQPLQGISDPIHGRMNINSRASGRVVPQQALKYHDVNFLVIEMGCKCMP